MTRPTYTIDEAVAALVDASALTPSGSMEVSIPELGQVPDLAQIKTFQDRIAAATPEGVDVGTMSNHEEGWTLLMWKPKPVPEVVEEGDLNA